MLKFLKHTPLFTILALNWAFSMEGIAALFGLSPWLFVGILLDLIKLKTVLKHKKLAIGLCAMSIFFAMWYPLQDYNKKQAEYKLFEATLPQKKASIQYAINQTKKAIDENLKAQKTVNKFHATNRIKETAEVRENLLKDYNKLIKQRTDLKNKEKPSFLPLMVMFAMLILLEWCLITFGSEFMQDFFDVKQKPKKTSNNNVGKKTRPMDEQNLTLVGSYRDYAKKQGISRNEAQNLFNLWQKEKKLIIKNGKKYLKEG